MEPTDDFNPTTGRILQAATVFVVVGLLFVAVFLIAGFRSWSVGIGMFLGMPILVLGMVLYVVSVIRDLAEHNVFRSGRKDAQVE